MSANTFVEPYQPPQGIAHLLDLAVSNNNFEGAYVYQFEHGSAAARLVAFSGAPVPVPPESLADLSARVSTAPDQSVALVALHARAAEDPRFATLPEFQFNRFEGVVSLPLIDSARTIGIVNFCKKGRLPISPAIVGFLTRLSIPLAELLAGASLRRQFEKATRDLANRKLVERAKGLLQEAFKLTEEQAYLHLRRVSRQQRRPLPEIALRVIKSHTTTAKDVA